MLFDSNLSDFVNAVYVLLIIFMVLGKVIQLLLWVVWNPQVVLPEETKGNDWHDELVYLIVFWVTGPLKCFVIPAITGGQLKFTWRNNPGTFISLSADGVALGAAASTSQTSVQLIVFVAIMLHKVSQQPKICSLVIKNC